MISDKKGSLWYVKTNWITIGIVWKIVFECMISKYDSYTLLRKRFMYFHVMYDTKRKSFKNHSLATNLLFFFFHVLFNVLSWNCCFWYFGKKNDENEAMAICDLLTVLFPAPGTYIFKMKAKRTILYMRCDVLPLYWKRCHINLNNPC